MNVVERYKQVVEKAKIAAKNGGFEPPKVVAVSKFQSIDVMCELANELANQGEKVIFGESYVQEYQKKRPQLPPHTVHMIGRLQRNKAREAVQLFDVIESMHSLSLAEALNKEAEKLGKIQEVFLQVNISNDVGKAGFLADELLDALPKLLSYSALKITGVMTITKDYENREDVVNDFQDLYALAGVLQREFFQQQKPFQISMGMSADYDLAAGVGATVVRVGSAIFGERDYNKSR